MNGRSLISSLAAAVIAGLALAGAAQAGTGGLAIGGPPQATGGPSRAIGGPAQAPRPRATAQYLRGAHFGTRPLRPGMRGDDVRALHGIVKSVPYGHRVGLHGYYHRRTSGIVKRFQRERSITPTGFVNRRTARELVRTMDVANATWYGPGFYGATTACGMTLTTRTLGVAHRTLPCGTKVTFRHRGRSLVTRVIDRGPFTSGIEWDLTNAARLRLGFDGTGPVRYVVAD